MSYFSSLGTEIQMANQPAWIDKSSSSKTLPTLTTAIPATGESMSMSFERLEPETMLATNYKKVSIASTASCSGSVDAPLSADFADLVFASVMGASSSSSDTVTLPTITGITYPQSASNIKKYYNPAVGAIMPLLTLVMKRGNQENATYPNLTLNSLSLSCANNETCDATLEFIGTEEILGTDTSAYSGIQGIAVSSSVSAESIPYINTASVLSIGGASRCAESVTINLNNNAQESPRCFQDGQLANRPYFGRKEASLAVQMPWDGAAGFYKTLKSEYYGKNKTIEAAFMFKDSADHYVLIHCPACYVSESSYNASGDGLIDGSINLDVANAALADGEYDDTLGGVQIYTFEG